MNGMKEKYMIRKVERFIAANEFYAILLLQILINVCIDLILSNRVRNNKE